MKNIHKKIQTASNIAIIVVALMLGGVLVNNYFYSPSPKPVIAGDNTIKAGTKLELPDANWNKSDKTLVMAVSTKCHFCTESIPFYKRIAEKKAGNKNVRLIAVTPQTTDEAKQYLDEHKLSVDEMKQSSLDKIQVGGTPTLILVDRKGAVIESWRGKLPPEKEAEVIKRLFG